MPGVAREFSTWKALRGQRPRMQRELSARWISVTKSGFPGANLQDVVHGYGEGFR